MVDSGGLLCAERYEDLSKRKRQFATHTLPEGLSQPKLPLQEVIGATPCSSYDSWGQLEHVLSHWLLVLPCRLCGQLALLA